MTIKRWMKYSILTIQSVNRKQVYRRKMTYGLNFIKDASKKQFLIFIIFWRFNQANSQSSWVSMILLATKIRMKKRKWPRDLVKARHISRKYIWKITMEKVSTDMTIFAKDCYTRPFTKTGLINKLTILILFSMPFVKLSK